MSLRNGMMMMLVDISSYELQKSFVFLVVNFIVFDNVSKIS